MAFFRKWPVKIFDEDTGEPITVFVDFFYFPAANYTNALMGVTNSTPPEIHLDRVEVDNCDYEYCLAAYQIRHIESVLLENMLSS